MECLYRGAVWWVDCGTIRQVMLPKVKGSILGTLLGAAALGSVTAINGSKDDALIGVGGSVVLGGYVGYLIGHVVDKGKGAVIYQAP